MLEEGVKDGVMMLFKLKTRGRVMTLEELMMMLLLVLPAEKVQVIPEGTEQVIPDATNYWGKVIRR